MNKKRTFILMYQNLEVLSFCADFRKSRIFFLEKLTHFEKAPYGFDQDKEGIQQALNRFFWARTISEFRKDYKQILKATHCRNGFNLSFRGHGLSLSNHYWVKKVGETLRYEGINFFNNPWDDSFAKAVLSEDYEALSKADLNVPDIVTGGYGVKGWIYDEKKGPRLYKLGIHPENPEESLGEVLASSLAKRIFQESEVLSYDLEKIYGRYASVCSPLIGVDEELVPLSFFLPSEFYRLYHDRSSDKNVRRLFFQKLKDAGYSDLYDFFVKLTCLRSLCFVNDLHFGNISVVRNIPTGAMRIAPLYDLGGSFGSSNTAKQFLAKPNKTTLFLIYFLYGGLDPAWDYSWYDKEKMIGFEDEIRNVLSKSDFYTSSIIDFIVSVYHQQKSSLDEISSRNREESSLAVADS